MRNIPVKVGIGFDWYYPHIIIYDEETEFFEKNCSYSKRHLYQIGEAQNLPVIAGRLLRKNFRDSDFRNR